MTDSWHGVVKLLIVRWMTKVDHQTKVLHKKIKHTHIKDWRCGHCVALHCHALYTVFTLFLWEWSGSVNRNEKLMVLSSLLDYSGSEHEHSINPAVCLWWVSPSFCSYCWSPFFISCSHRRLVYSWILCKIIMHFVLFSRTNIYTFLNQDAFIWDAKWLKFMPTG